MCGPFLSLFVHKFTLAPQRDESCLCDFSLFRCSSCFVLIFSRKVAEMMRQKGLNLGGESSGHVVASQYLPTGDGLLTALMVTRASCESKESIHSLSDQIILWPSVEGSFLVKEKIPIEECDELYSIFQKVKIRDFQKCRRFWRPIFSKVNFCAQVSKVQYFKKSILTINQI